MAHFDRTNKFKKMNFDIKCLTKRVGILLKSKNLRHSLNAITPLMGSQNKNLVTKSDG